MGILKHLLGFPVTLPLAGIGWVVDKMGEAAETQWADPGRIEAALMRLEKRLDSGEITEDEFEEAEAELLAELREIRAAKGLA
jgi:hypothetical protein